MAIDIDEAKSNKKKQRRPYKNVGINTNFESNSSLLLFLILVSLCGGFLFSQRLTVPILIMRPEAVMSSLLDII